MGWIKKTLKKVVKIANNPLGGGDDEKKNQTVEAAQVAAPTPVVSNVEGPKKDSPDDADDADTEASKKDAKKRGKRELSVARSSGTGVNL